MAITVFAAIDVGSHETAMRIYEISKNTVYMNWNICITQRVLGMRHFPQDISAITRLISSVIFYSALRKR